nr:hypothetical protein GCM10017611_22590 [Rhodococcus wratislaviensis]
MELSVRRGFGLLGQGGRRRFRGRGQFVGGPWSATVSACTRDSSSPGPHPVDENAVSAAEAARPHTGRTVDAALTPQTTDIDLGGIHVRTLAYGNTVPGTTIRANVGDEVAVALTNGLDHETSVHWHGIALRNDMDGASPASPDIGPGQRFTYQFSVPHAGTYWAHPHVGLDTDYALYLPVIVDDPNEHGDYDAEWIVILDDWTDGIGPGPQQILSNLQSGGMGSMGGPGGMGNMPGMGMRGGSDRSGAPTSSTTPNGAGTSTLLGGDAGDITYPHYLITDESRPHRRRSRPHQASACGSASSTPAPTPPSASPSPSTP